MNWLSDEAILTDFRAWRKGVGHSDHLLVLYSLASYLDAPTIVEIGVRAGRSTRVLLAAVEHVGGFVYSCDIDPRFADSVPPEHRNNWRFFGEPSGELGKRWKKSIDLLLIDGDHGYDQAKEDFDLFAPWVRPGGYVVMHDATDGNPNSQVSAVIDGIDRAQWHVGILRLGAGTAVLQRRQP